MIKIFSRYFECLSTTASSTPTFFLFLCLTLVESCPMPPFPRAPDSVFPRCCGPAAPGGVGVGGGVFSGESRLLFIFVVWPKRCGYQNKKSSSHCKTIFLKPVSLVSWTFCYRKYNTTFSLHIREITVIADPGNYSNCCICCC